MFSDPALFTLFLLGLFGGTHCIGMCGGLSSAFALQLPPHIKRTHLILTLNAGRLTSYAIIGALMGALAQIGSFLHHAHSVQHALFIGAHLLLFITGLSLAGIWANARLEIIGKPIWRKLNPYLQKHLPIQSLPASFIVGAIWGWLPCGLVYNAALYALSSQHATQGALYLLAFGLGTLPHLLAIGLFAAQLKTFLQHKMIRMITGLSISAWALWQLFHAIAALYAA